MTNRKRKSNNPTLKKIAPNSGSSFTVKRFVKSTVNSLPYWHFHPEIELVFIDQGKGKRHIGNHISNYTDGDLILMGSNVPHYGFAGRLTKNESEIVVHFLPEFLGVDFFDGVEMSDINILLQKSKQGLSFSGKTKLEVGNMMIRLMKLKGIDRLVQLIRILNRLATSEEVTALNVNGVYLEVYSNQHNRINLIYNYISEHFTDTMELSDIASLVSMTVPAFCRYFKKVTNKTFTQYVNEYRIVHAQKLLSENDDSIIDVCMSSGFNNVSHFNKQFRLHTGKNPSEYKKELKTVVQ